MNQKKIRNFCIIAHIDHGKSTLSDRILELTESVTKHEMHEQYMDTLELEQERGITIKLQTARMKYSYQNEEYILNLIDTPGHVDFSYEVSRSLAACEGAVLLVDATQGVEAQTISNTFKAIEHDLEIIPVINKIDLPNAEPERRAIEMSDMLGFKVEEVVFTSGKTGEGVKELLDKIITKIPPPKGESASPLQGLIFDSFYDDHKGVVAQVRVVNGQVTQKDISNKRKFKFIGTKNDIIPIEIGYLTPKLIKANELSVGEVGYIATGQKDIQKIRVGDTVTFTDETAELLSGYEKVNPMVYAGLYPTDTNRHTEFREALEKLSLNDAALQFIPESSKALGFGFRCGFLGLLHMEIIQERLEREYDIDLIVTAPSVEYKVDLKGKGDNIFNPKDFDEDGYLIITSASNLPDPSHIESISEPWVEAEIITPSTYLGDIMSMCQSKRGIQKNTNYIQSDSTSLERVILKYEIPLSEVITDFFDQIKSLTHGYASLDYNFLEYREGNIVKLDVLVLNEPVDSLSILIDKDSVQDVGKKLVERLKEVIPKHQFKVPIQAAVGGKIIAREDVPAYKKDVTSGLYGGDHRRKLKHIERQKEGKKRMKMLGKVNIPQEAFLSILKK